MAKIIPFCAVRYNQNKIKNIQSVVTPPYDVISKKEQSEFYKISRYNFIRLILGREEEGDDRANNRYTRAREFLKEWLDKNILIKDDVPSMYIYEQRYKIENNALRRIGFIALMKLESAREKIVFPHEKTFCKPKEDRLALLKATKANLSPIFGLYADKDFKIDKLLETKCRMKPIIDVESQAVKNRLWKIEDENFSLALRKLMLNKKIFIADGHHRYEVACFYNKLMKGSKNINPVREENFSSVINSGYVMTYFCNLYSNGLKILPTHRVIRRLGKDVLSALSEYFKVEGLSSKSSLFSKLKIIKKGERLFGLYLGNGRFYLVRVKKNREGFSHYNNLDVVLLHNIILKRILGIKEKKRDACDILYTRDEQLAIDLVRARKYQAAFFMNAPQPKEVANVANLLQRMPHKSTYFYPKPLSGLLINRLSERKDVAL